MQVTYLSDCKKMRGLDRVKSCEKVILFHFPLSPYTKVAINAIKAQCDSEQDQKVQQYCYETLRSSLIQIRSFYSPYNEIMEEIIPKIAHLRAKEAIEWQHNLYSVQDYERLYSDNIVLLKYDNAPSVFWSSVVVISLLGWISSVMLVIFKGLIKPFRTRFIIVYTAIFLLFFSLWLMGLWMA